MDNTADLRNDITLFGQLGSSNFNCRFEGLLFRFQLLRHWKHALSSTLVEKCEVMTNEYSISVVVAD